MLTLPPSDPNLGPSGSKLVKSFTLVPEINKPIEQVGSAYERLKLKVQKQTLRHEEMKKK